MDPIVNLLIFGCLGMAIIGFSLLAVITRKILRAATYLLFTLIGTAGLYMYLNYHFLAAVQVSVYAGGVVVLFIFAILLTSNKGDAIEPHGVSRIFYAILAAFAGIAVVGFALFKTKFAYDPNNTTMIGDQEINMKVIGQALMGTEKYQYLMPFEMLSILLLACIIGGILIARKR